MKKINKDITKIKNSLNKTIFICFLILFLSIFGGCKTLKTDNNTSKYVYNYSHRADTVLLATKDSVIIFQKGDTIHEKIIQIRYFENKSYKIDTVFQKDTIKTIRTETKEVKKPLSQFKKMMIIFGYNFIFIIFAIVIYLIYKIYKKIKI